MIKLKMSPNEMKALSRFLQIAIEIMRYEIMYQTEVQIIGFSDNICVKTIQWPRENKSQSIMRIMDGNARIDEFERLQLKLVISGAKTKNAKSKSIEITKTAANFIFQCVGKVKHAYYIINASKDGMDYVNFVAQTQADVIMKNLI